MNSNVSGQTESSGGASTVEHRTTRWRVPKLLERREASAGRTIVAKGVRRSRCCGHRDEQTARRNSTAVLADLCNLRIEVAARDFITDRKLREAHGLVLRQPRVVSSFRPILLEWGDSAVGGKTCGGRTGGIESKERWLVEPECRRP